MNKTNKLLKNTFIIGIGVLCTKVISFIMIPLYTSWLNPLEYGNYDLLVSYLTLFVPFITVELEQAIFRFSLKKPSMAKVYFINAFFIATINMILADIIALLILHNSDCKYAFIVYFNSYSLYVLIFEYLRGIKKLKEYSIYNIIISILILGMNFVFVPFLKMNARGLIYSFGIAYLIVDIFIALKEGLISSLIKLKINFKILKDMITYSLPMIPNGISWWITNVSDRTMIRVFIGEFYNGLYAVSCKIPTIISLLFSIFNLSWQQSAIENSDDNDKNIFYNKTFNYLVPLLFCGGIVIITLTPLLFKYLINEEYYQSIINVPILVLGSIFLCFSQFFNGLLLANKKTKKIGLSTSIAAIINVTINLIFMKKYGLIIAGISTLVSYIFLFVYRYAIFKDIFKKNTIIRIIIYSVLFSVFSAICLILKNTTVMVIMFIVSIILFLKNNIKLIKFFYNKISSKLKRE